MGTTNLFLGEFFKVVPERLGVRLRKLVIGVVSDEQDPDLGIGRDVFRMFNLKKVSH